MIFTEELLVLSTLLFLIGIFGVLVRTNAIMVFLCIELMLNAANLSLIAFATHYQNHHGLLLAFFVVILAACEAVVGLAIILVMHRQRQSIELDHFQTLKS